MEKERMFCKVCNTQTNLTIDSFSRYHLKKEHCIGMKEYYDLVVRKDNEGKCLHCGKETKFVGYYKGYRKFCCTYHQQISEYTRNKISKSFQHRNIAKESEKRKKTCLKKYGVEVISMHDSFKEKYKNTCLERYGVEHNFLIDTCIENRWKVLNDNKDEINKKRKLFWNTLTEEDHKNMSEKRKKTCLEKYGVEYVSQDMEIGNLIRQTQIHNGNWSSNIDKTSFEKYRHKVRIITNKYRNIMLERCDNMVDYYTGELLVDNDTFLKNNPYEGCNTNPLQPTIDHKVSIYYGFVNNIDPEEIGSYDNLCICSRRTNCTKNRLTEDEFIEQLGGLNE